MVISKKLYDKILSAFSYDGRERGGLIFLQGNKIVSFFLDKAGTSTRSTYRPDIDSLRSKIESAAKKGCDDFAFVHCHPDHESISGADIEYIRSFLHLNDISCSNMFLVQCDRILCYRITCSKCDKILLQICSDAL